MFFRKLKNNYGGLLLGLLLCFLQQNLNCASGVTSFELITGHVYSASTNTMKTIPGTLQLTDCLDFCQKEPTCQSINFETGLCVIFNSSASNQPQDLQPSQFPVFTIYAQKVSFTERVRGVCSRSWTFERVPGFELRKYGRKQFAAESRLECMEVCLLERAFECRSFNFDYEKRECSLSDMDRHTLATGNNNNVHNQRHFLPSSSGTVDYFENNCVKEPNKLCDFKPSKGRILKTVDSVYQDITTVEGCKEKCMGSPYRCFSFDFGDPANPVCRTSHLDRSSLTHIEEPFLEINGAVTYELASCYNVTILCKAREMVAHVKTSKVFNGKIYAKNKPNSCVNDIQNSLEFEISMPYHDVMCDVKQKDQGTFYNDIIIQHHDMIVTTQDLGLSLHCNYDLSNRSVSNVKLEVDGDVENREGDENYVHSSVVGGPNVSMVITDREGVGIQAAQVGDPLSLRFEIAEKYSPYEILVRELVAVDGVDASEILLIDGHGCPTDVSIMGPMLRVNGNGQILEAPFDAFKFPTSDVVQFRALVTPCIPHCEPVHCDTKGYDGKKKEMTSFGKRKRRSEGSYKETALDEEMVVVQSIKIVDSFDFPKKGRKVDPSGKLTPAAQSHYETFEEIELRNRGSCTSFLGLMVSCSLFLLAQLLLIVAWAMLWFKRQRQQHANKLLETASYISGFSGYSKNMCQPQHHHQTFGSARKGYDPYATMKSQLSRE